MFKRSWLERLWSPKNDYEIFEERKRAERRSMSPVERAASLQQEKARRLINEYIRHIVRFRSTCPTEHWEELIRDVPPPCKIVKQDRGIELEWKGSIYGVHYTISPGGSFLPDQITCNGEVVLLHHTSENFAQYVYTFKDGAWTEDLRDLPPLLEKFVADSKLWYAEYEKRKHIEHLKKNFNI